MTHPNAAAGATTTGVAAAALYIAQQLGLKGFTSEDALFASGALITVVLFIGRRGIKGTLSAIWTGVWKGPAPTA